MNSPTLDRRPISSMKLPVIVRQEIEEWVATVAPRSAQREFRAALKHVAILAHQEGYISGHQEAGG